MSAFLRTQFLGDAPHLENCILKPLFSFAGLGGINLHPMKSDIAAIVKDRRGDYILQERMNFQPVNQTPFGMTKAEIRIMYLWDDRCLPVLTIIRMGRGEMMGVDHNKEMEWVGSSAGLFPV